MALGDSWRVGVPRDEHTALVTNGPFAWVRNPIFTAMLISAAGLLLLVPNLAALGAWTAMLVGLEIHVRLVEEPHLLNMHGDAYAKYAARVGRFWPYLGRLR
jgi:protein-S-isoprenylcysteine O-methyltransferase Ste14